MDRSVIALAADVIEPYITSPFKQRQLAECSSRTLANTGLLADGGPAPKSGLPVREQAVNVLQCQHEWATAEKIAAELDTAGLLKGTDRG
ncbi:hypothetical protein ACIODS_11975 [Micromonospora chalcea]|uniref:hypothetical protein n=1 Tax=Micromonospora chalcea TaxID=1874 RepID=UPI0037F5A8CA